MVLLIDIAVPGDTRVEEKEQEKINKYSYQYLARCTRTEEVSESKPLFIQGHLKSMTLNDLERQFTALSSYVMCIVTKWLRLEFLCFRYKVALYLSYPHIKFDIETKRNPFEFNV